MSEEIFHPSKQANTMKRKIVMATATPILVFIQPLTETMQGQA